MGEMTSNLTNDPVFMDEVSDGAYSNYSTYVTEGVNTDFNSNLQFGLMSPGMFYSGRSLYNGFNDSFLKRFENSIIYRNAEKVAQEKLSLIKEKRETNLGIQSDITDLFSFYGLSFKPSDFDDEAGDKFEGIVSRFLEAGGTEEELNAKLETFD